MGPIFRILPEPILFLALVAADAENIKDIRLFPTKDFQFSLKFG
jgi:hypothetical protein